MATFAVQNLAVLNFAWAFWLAAPVALVLLAAALIWWRGRARAVPSMRAGIRAHHAFLDTLTAAQAQLGVGPARVPAQAPGNDTA